MLEVTDLSHTYRRGGVTHTAIEGISFKVADDELVSIVGPSGSGKSTLLRCLAGLQRPTGGTVLLNGEPVEQIPDGLAVVFQDYSRSLFPWLTVLDNVALPLRRRGQGRSERRAAALASLEAVGLRDAASRHPWQLSGGMQQRVAIARAIAYHPTLLLMDEPFGSVDAQTREDLEDLVLQVRRDRQMTILLVTHDIDESVYVGDRVIVLTTGPGRVLADLSADLPPERDQITTKELPEFVRLRTQIGRLVRGHEAPLTAEEPTLEPGPDGPVAAAAAEDPSEPAAETPTAEPAAQEPAPQPASDKPAEEDPASADEAPAQERAAEQPAPEPADGEPETPPAETPPAETPVAELPAEAPAPEPAGKKVAPRGAARKRAPKSSSRKSISKPPSEEPTPEPPAKESAPQAQS